MSQAQMNLYAFPHKGLRNALSQFSLIVGSTKPYNQNLLNIMKSIVNELVILLKLHAYSE